MRAGRIENHLGKLIAQRQTVIISRLNAQDLPAPKISVKFLNPNQLAGAHSSGRISIFAATIRKSTDQEIRRTIDHEVAHYVQMNRNPHTVIWNKILRYSAYTAFVEGFAEFASSLTSSGTDHRFQREQVKLLTRTNVKGELKPYLIGYMRYLSIARYSSPDNALRIGLKYSIQDWMTEAKIASRQLGTEFF